MCGEWINLVSSLGNVKGKRGDMDCVLWVKNGHFTYVFRPRGPGFGYSYAIEKETTFRTELNSEPPCRPLQADEALCAVETKPLTGRRYAR